MVYHLSIFHIRRSNSTGRHQFPSGSNFVIFLLEIGLQTCVYKMFISSSVWMIPVDTSVERPKTEIGTGPKDFYAVR
jgi:hypothetical protein